MQSVANRDTCIFTIVSNNYLHYANTLFESLVEHCPGADRILALCDRPTEATECPAATDVLALEQLDIPLLGAFIYQYSILELNTAIKPYVIEQLMRRGYRKIIYFDPDIRVFHSLDPMFDLLERHNVLLTPHLTHPLGDGKLPGELQILQSGSYNLGYIGLRSGEETHRLVKWWQAKLYKDCVVDLPRNLFVDQKWMDLVPSMFDGVYINRDPSWNIAYWNLNHRQLRRDDDGRYSVDGRALVFFHFSGFSIEAQTLSKHQDRFRKDASPALNSLCQSYAEALLRNGIRRFAGLPYAFGRFADGVRVPELARRLIRTDDRLAALDYFDPAQCPRLHARLNRPVTAPRQGIALSALALALWQAREDLRNAFPDVEDADSVAFGQWLLDSAARETDFDPCYLQPIGSALERLQRKRPGPSGRPAKTVARLLLGAWKHRQRIPRPLRRLMAPVASRLAPRALDHLPATAAYVLDESLPSSTAPGINLIGYLQAESGIGEAARASLRALRQSDLPFALVDYRLGNLSRMGEYLGNHVNQAYYPINLVHVNADQSRIAREHLGEALFEGRYNIGYWYWEMPEFPDFLHFAYAEVDEIWVSTEYNRQAIARHTDKPVRVIPPAIEVRLEKPLSRADLHLPEDCFIFLHLSDVLSIPQRKNPLGVIEAFRQAFGATPQAKVRLVIKLSNLDHQPTLCAALFAAMDGEPRIQLIRDYLDRNTLNNLLGACDCYVSLHRAEGFGLPIAEAMYLGKPVIATHWSGNVDFMDEDNSLPVDYRLVELQDDYGPYRKGQCWAEPDIPMAARRMHEVAHSPAIAERLGRAASASIRQRLSPASSAMLIRRRVEEIAAARMTPA